MQLFHSVEDLQEIPEIVQSITSVTPRTTRTRTNRYGHFMYRHMRSELFWGYHVVAMPHGKYLLAEPEKALLDYIYLNTSRLNSLADIEGLRLNIDMVKKTMSMQKLKTYCMRFHSKKMSRILTMILAYVDA